MCWLCRRDRKGPRDLGTNFSANDFANHLVEPQAVETSQLLRRVLRGGVVRGVLRELKSRTRNQGTRARGAARQRSEPERFGTVRLVGQETAIAAHASTWG